MPRLGGTGGKCGGWLGGISGKPVWLIKDRLYNFASEMAPPCKSLPLAVGRWWWKFRGCWNGDGKWCKTSGAGGGGRGGAMLWLLIVFLDAAEPPDKDVDDPENGESWYVMRNYWVIFLDFVSFWKILSGTRLETLIWWIIITRLNHTAVSLLFKVWKFDKKNREMISELYW